MLLPTRNMKETLEKLAVSPFEALHRIRYKAAWDKRQTQQREVQEKAQEKERVSYQQIDWHDFVVVDTVEFGAEDVDLPVPVKLADLGAHVLEMEKFEQKQKEKKTSHPVGITDTKQAEASASCAAGPATGACGRRGVYSSVACAGLRARA